VKVIVPLAGKGTRLLPLTRRVPKPLVHVAGRPVMDYVMDAITGGGLDVEELIVITGHLKEEIQKHIVGNYDVRARFVEQKTLDGTAGAINLARPYVDGPVLIVFVDTLFEADLSLVRTADADGILWAKEVEDYRRFGVIVTDGGGYMTRIVEKPETPVSKLANIGLYYVRDWRTLFEGIAHVLAQPPNKGEYYLTDAFQYMVERGRRLLTSRVAGWYDCGKVDTLLETNRHLLQRGRALAPAAAAARGCTIIPPVRIEEGVTLRGATVGPNVTIESGSTIEDSTVANSILGRNVRVTRATVRDSLVGDDQVIADRELLRSVADAGEIAPAQ